MPPTSAYPRALTAAITRNMQIPRAMRNECHRLLQAIEANDASSIAESVACIESLAATASVELPGRVAAVADMNQLAHHSFNRPAATYDDRESAGQWSRRQVG